MIYEDPLITVTYPEQGAVQGHLIVAPRKAVDSVAEMNTELMERMSLAASLVATALFETLGAEGSNIILNEQPVRYDVLARRQGDNWDHSWTPKKLEQGAMEEAKSRISDNTPLPVAETKPEVAIVEVPKQEEPETPQTLEELEEQENYLVRQLTKRP